MVILVGKGVFWAIGRLVYLAIGSVVYLAIITIYFLIILLILILMSGGRVSLLTSMGRSRMLIPMGEIIIIIMLKAAIRLTILSLKVTVVVVRLWAKGGFQRVLLIRWKISVSFMIRRKNQSLRRISSSKGKGRWVWPSSSRIRFRRAGSIRIISRFCLIIIMRTNKVIIIGLIENIKIIIIANRRVWGKSGWTF